LQLYFKTGEAIPNGGVNRGCLDIRSHQFVLVYSNLGDTGVNLIYKSEAKSTSITADSQYTPLVTLVLVYK